MIRSTNTQEQCSFHVSKVKTLRLKRLQIDLKILYATLSIQYQQTNKHLLRMQCSTKMKLQTFISKEFIHKQKVRVLDVVGMLCYPSPSIYRSSFLFKIHGCSTWNNRKCQSYFLILLSGKKKIDLFSIYLTVNQHYPMFLEIGRNWVLTFLKL